MREHRDHVLCPVKPTAAFDQAAQPAVETKPLTILLLLNALPAWLSLPREAREAYFRLHLQPLLADTDLDVRFFDSEYFHGTVSDFLLVTVRRLEAWELFMERLRDTEIYTKPYFHVVDIIPGRENAFRDLNEQLLKK